MPNPPLFAASGPFRSKRNIFLRMSMDGHGLAVLIGEEGDMGAFIHVVDAGGGL